MIGNPNPKSEDRFLYIWVIRPTGEIDFRQIDIEATTSGFSLNDWMEQTHYALGVRGLGILPRDAIDIVVEEGDIATRETPLHTLHQLLIEPISDLLPKTPEELFIPHGELFPVPFPALQDANGTQLIDKHTILTAPAIRDGAK